MKLTYADVLEMVERGILHEYKTVTAGGYVSVHDDGIVVEYSGRYGRGYKVLQHNSRSTRYCIATYYLYQSEGK